MLKSLLKIDWLILLPALLLVSLSLLMIFSTSVSQTGTDWSYFTRQLIYALIGLGVFFFFALSDYRVFVRYSFFLYLFLLVLLLVTYLIGVETRGSVRWIDLKFVTIQASEFAKPIMILFLSYLFTRYPPQRLRYFLISLFVVLLPLALIFNQPDLGSAAILGFIWFALVFVSGANFFFIFTVILLPLISFPLVWQFLKDYQKSRLESFLNPTSDPLGRGYNLVQAIIAVGSGQLFGRGLGRGTQSHLNFLPEQKTDFIFATMAEELGFLGVLLLLGLFAFLIHRLLSSLTHLHQTEGSLIIVGVVVTLMTQLFINVGMNLGLLPITGITLPLVSFGGSSLVSVFAMLGLVESVLVVSRQQR
ncbi:MAG: rod shape-determining protein RodA [bacterium]|nr:rod shape-determining protein RodA [bacterium]